MYIVDFLCKPLNLIVEIDGIHHSNDISGAHDARRTIELEKRGFVVKRLPAFDVLANAEGCSLRLRAWCEELKG